MNKFITPIVLILIAAGIFWGYVDPTYQEIKTLKRTKADYDSAIGKSQELLKLRDGLLDKYNSFKGEDLKRMERLLPSSIDNVRLIIDINGVTSKYGASLKDVKVSSADELKTTNGGTAMVGGSGYNSMVLNFSIEATYENFISILADLEKSLRVLDVASISFKTGETDVFKYEVGVRTYWLGNTN